MNVNATLSALLLAATVCTACTSSSDGPGDSAPRDGSAPTTEASSPKPGPSGPSFCDLPGVDSPLIQVPEGFCVREYYPTLLLESRVMRFSPGGDLFVAVPSVATPGGAANGLGGIVILPDDDRDGIADRQVVYAGGSPGVVDNACGAREQDPEDVSCVHGLAFKDGYLYFTRSDEVRRTQYTAGQRAKAGASELVATLGGGGSAGVRWTHTLAFGKDGMLYVSRGRFDTSTCSADDMKVGAVLAIDVESGAALPVQAVTVADGFRNPMYLRASPKTNDVFAAELSGDNWFGIGGREKLAVVEPSGRWGYPCCVGKNMPALSGSMNDCADIGEELISIPLSNTPFGFDFEPGNFPSPYTNGAFFALHGAFGMPWRGTGLSWLPVDGVTGRPTGALGSFATGWSSNFPGRATDAVFAPDGRLFVIDDTQGRIFWIAPRSLARP